MSKDIEHYEVRLSTFLDGEYISEWMKTSYELIHFPIANEYEAMDAAQKWISFVRCRSSLTVVDSNGTPRGIITAFLQPYKSLSHQSEFGLIVCPKSRGKGIGSLLIKKLIEHAKDVLKLDELNLTVIASNPAIRLYKRFGFIEYGRHKSWVKRTDGTTEDRVMMALDLTQDR